MGIYIKYNLQEKSIKFDSFDKIQSIFTTLS